MTQLDPLFSPTYMELDWDPNTEIVVPPHVRITLHNTLTPHTTHNTHNTQHTLRSARHVVCSNGLCLSPLCFLFLLFLLLLFFGFVGVLCNIVSDLFFALLLLSLLSLLYQRCVHVGVCVFVVCVCVCVCMRVCPLALQVLATPIICDLERDGHDELIVPVSYFFTAAQVLCFVFGFYFCSATVCRLVDMLAVCVFCASRLCVGPLRNFLFSVLFLTAFVFGLCALWCLL
jgi:hypothetical protein